MSVLPARPNLEHLKKQAKALLAMLHEAKITQTDTSGAVDKQFDYSLLSEATGKPKTELGGQ